ncbi:MAG: DegT/DnrJ/EryC1/StrS family aminotransferase [Thermaerobacterales bacterium]
MKADFAWLNHEMEANALEALRATAGTYGPFTRKFEAALAELCEVEHVICMSSGTAAMHLIMVAMGIGPGDEVILPAFSYVANCEAILHVGAQPVFCDVLPQSGLIDPAAAARAVNSSTRAIMVEHLYGHPADMAALEAIAAPRGIHLVEDAAHALGGAVDGRRAGSIGTANVLSFARKVIDTRSPGGAAATNDASLGRELALLRRHGREVVDGRQIYRPARVAYNVPIAEVSAAIGIVQLKHLPEFSRRRADNARRYRRALEGHPTVQPMPVADNITHANLHFAVRSERRQALIEFLQARSIPFAIYYADLVYQQPCFIERIGHRPGPFPAAETFYESALRLPCHPGLSDDDVETVAEALAAFR